MRSMPATKPDFAVLLSTSGTAKLKTVAVIFSTTIASCGLSSQHELWRWWAVGVYPLDYGGPVGAFDVVLGIAVDWFHD